MSLTTISPVIPVVTIRDAETAVPIARALLAGGVGIIELTLRTPAALTAISRIAAEVPEMVVGAGTVVSERLVAESVTAGAQFLVSPGTPAALLSAMQSSGLPFLPGAATVSEIMTLLDAGVTALKFFPASAAGGPGFLSALAAPLPSARFCPTGGIAPQTARDYLALPNVDCIGGSWLTPKHAVAAGDWNRITQLAAESRSL
jgi:2-dehydro-3-deoxyphosphogluconate aldolase / (4S)-4-hydroxy-2-oxoglutarate aldolase